MTESHKSKSSITVVFFHLINSLDGFSHPFDCNDSKKVFALSL